MKRSPGRVALLEIGSNSTKLLIADAGPEDFRVRHVSRRTTRIGRGIGSHGWVAPAAVKNNIAAIDALKEIIAKRRCEHVFAFSTFALRRAVNATWVTHRLEGAIGGSLRVISGRDEARFAYASAERNLRLTRPATVLIDIGGGSTEIVAAKDHRVFRARSLPIGALSLTERFIHTDPIDAAEYSALERRALGVTRDAMRRMGIDRMEARDIDLVASGGTIGALSWVIADSGRLGRPHAAFRVMGGTCRRRRPRAEDLPVKIRLGEAQAFLERCLSLPLRERRRIPGLDADRADIVCAGLAILLSVMRTLGKRVLQPNRGGVREGALLHIIRNGLRW